MPTRKREKSNNCSKNKTHWRFEEYRAANGAARRWSQLATCIFSGPLKDRSASTVLNRGEIPRQRLAEPWRRREPGHLLHRRVPCCYPNRVELEETGDHQPQGEREGPDEAEEGHAEREHPEGNTERRLRNFLQLARVARQGNKALPHATTV